MQNAAERMQRLINDLLTSRASRSRGREFEPVDLGEIAREVIADLEARVVELGRQLDVGDASGHRGRPDADAAAAPEPPRQRAEVPPRGRTAG